MPLAALPDAEIHYEIVGDGPPLLLVPGLGGVASYWTPNVAGLAEHFTVILHDHRGCGRSSKPETAYSVELLADDLVKLMDVIGVDRASLLGHSTGGAIGQIIAATTPERIDRLVLYASWAALCPQMKQCMDFRRQALQTGGPAAYHRASPLFLYPPRYTCDEWVAIEAEFTSAAASTSPASILEARIDAIVEFDGTPYLPKVSAPTTILVADDDILTPPLCSEALARGIAGAQIEYFSYGGHAVSRVAPDVFNETALRVLTS